MIDRCKAAYVKSGTNNLSNQGDYRDCGATDLLRSLWGAQSSSTAQMRPGVTFTRLRTPIERRMILLNYVMGI